MSGFISDSNNHKIIVDDASSTVTYVGEAEPTSSTSDAVWRIKRISISGAITTIAWAGGAATFTNIWDNRASLSYS